MDTTKLFLFIKTEYDAQYLKKLKWTIKYHQAEVEILDLNITTYFHFKKDDPYYMGLYLLTFNIMSIPIKDLKGTKYEILREQIPITIIL